MKEMTGSPVSISPVPWAGAGPGRHASICTRLIYIYSVRVFPFSFLLPSKDLKTNIAGGGEDLRNKGLFSKGGFL